MLESSAYLSEYVRNCEFVKQKGRIFCSPSQREDLAPFLIGWSWRLLRRRTKNLEARQLFSRRIVCSSHRSGHLVVPTGEKFFPIKIQCRQRYQSGSLPVPFRMLQPELSNRTWLYAGARLDFHAITWAGKSLVVQTTLSGPFTSI